MQNPYRRLTDLTDPAAGHAEPWRTAIGLGVGLALYFGLCAGFLALVRGAVSARHAGICCPGLACPRTCWRSGSVRG